MKKHSLIYVLMVFVFLFSAACGRKETKKKTAPQNLQEKSVSVEEDSTQEAAVLLKDLSNKNPFRPDHSFNCAVASPVRSLVLKGIVWDKERPFAILGDSVVVEGDEIDGKKVIRIEKNAVILDECGEQEILKLQEID